MNNILTARALNAVISIAANNDSLVAGTKIYDLSRPDYTPGYLKDLNYGLASAILEEGGCVPRRMTLDDVDKASIREFIRTVTGHRWHHSGIPHRLVKVGRAARMLVG
jgi:hypothetical protein